MMLAPSQVRGQHPQRRSLGGRQRPPAVRRSNTARGPWHFASDTLRRCTHLYCAISTASIEVFTLIIPCARRCRPWGTVEQGQFARTTGNPGKTNEGMGLC